MMPFLKTPLVPKSDDLPGRRSSRSRTYSPLRQRALAGSAMRFMLAGFWCLLIGCASAAVPKSVGNLTLVRLLPIQGSAIEGTTILEATLEYRIVNFGQSSRYTIVPMFGGTREAGTRFNSFRSMAEGLTLTAPEGRVELRYPIHREWNDAKLARPVEIWFCLVEEPAETSIRVIATVGPYRFSDS